MDPLSGVASVIAVIQLTGTLVSICYEYRKSAKHAHKDIVRLTSELDSLGNVLKELLPLVEKEVAQGTARFKTTNILKEPLEQCTAELSELKIELQSGMTGGVLQSIGHVLVWPLKNSDIKKTFDRIERFKALLNLALTADQTLVNNQSLCPHIGSTDFPSTLLSAIQEDSIAIKDNMIVMTEALWSTSKGNKKLALLFMRSS